jgi:hypothetical protein
MREQPGLLKHQHSTALARPDQETRLSVLPNLVIDLDAGGSWLEQTRKDRQQRRFPRPRRPRDQKHPRRTQRHLIKTHLMRSAEGVEILESDGEEAHEALSINGSELEGNGRLRADLSVV